MQWERDFFFALFKVFICLTLVSRKTQISVRTSPRLRSLSYSKRRCASKCKLQTHIMNTDGGTLQVMDSGPHNFLDNYGV